jgi:mannose/cellobiose epimerase-like protein (N-acyl-D-glucosamine 2-epimerase family)
VTSASQTSVSVPPTENGSPRLAVLRLENFIRERALPLWASSGFDRENRCFHERLEYSGVPVRDSPRRLMVQTRQIVVYARASLFNWYSSDRQQIAWAFDSVCERYRTSDQDIGWTFSVHPDGSPADNTRDLYAHAFVLYMLAWMHRLTSDPRALALADITLSDIDRIFLTGNGPGYLSKVPGRTDLREQNPHMHLFEALLALAEASQADRYLAHANALIALFDDQLVDSATGTVRETFDANWRPLKPAGQNLVEPGHQLEWAWLLREWERLTGLRTEDRVQKLVMHATAFGIDKATGLVRGAVREDGSSASNASRVWGQTETIRALCREDAKGVMWPGLVSTITNNLFASHLPPHLDGGWIDQIDERKETSVDHMPGSTLYHLAGAAIDSSVACRP